MREQLKLLEELQQVDAQLQDTEEALSSLPAKLQSLKEDVDRVESLLEGERAQLAEVTRYKDELESGIKASQEALGKTKAKLTQVRTSKEYMASQREFESSRKLASEREEELTKLMQAIDNFEQSIKVHEEELAALRQHVAEEEQETSAKVKELERASQSQTGEREQKAKSIRRNVLAEYEAIRRRRGAAVVPAKNGVCTGCNMHLPPQLYNILQRGNSIEHCPSCHRIVYFDAEE